MPRAGLQRIEISVVVPLFDEQENLAELHRRLTAVLDAIDVNAEILLIDDGSRDNTALLIEALHARDARVVPLSLSRNFGHQAAVTAGIDRARGEAVIVMDADLQDPPELIPDLIHSWRDGNDVVYAVRRKRRESFPKRFAYAVFYRLLSKLGDHEIPQDAGDFCLMDRRVVEAMRSLPEHVRFVRGLRAFVGFRQVGLPYDRPARAAGKSKYTFAKLTRLAIDGLVSFSGQPLRLVTYLGITTATIALGMTVWVVVDAATSRTAPRGWASLVIVVLFMGSVQLLSLGIIGEYIRLIFLETKGRPSYIVREPKDVHEVKIRSIVRKAS